MTEIKNEPESNAVNPVAENTDPKRERLSGKSNYLGWSKMMKIELKEKNLINDKDKFESTTDSKAVAFILRNVSLSIVGTADDSNATTLWNWLAFEYGESNSWELRTALKRVKMVGVNLEDFFQRFNLALAKFKAAGGNMDLVDVCDLILENINQEFFLDEIRRNRLILRDTADVTLAVMRTMKTKLKSFYDATPESVRSKYSGVKLSNNVGQTRSKFDKRTCKWCQKHNRWRIQHTHTTENCRIGDVVGWENANPVNGANAAENASATSKNGSNYIAFHDSGSTPNSYFKSRPQNLQKHGGVVRVANNQSARIAGSGTVQFGEMKLNNVLHVPEFSKNLVSGMQIMKDGYKQVLQDDKLTVSRKDGRIVATGHFNEEVGLIQMDNDICNNSVISDYESIHKKLGHIGDQMLKNTLPAVDGVEVTIPTKHQQCQPCELGKSKRSKISPKSQTVLEVLEVIESDTQGPFPLVGFDGTTNNVKFIDSKSSYVKMETIPDREASTILDAFKRYKSRVERRTGKQILNIRTDMGTEYNGVFLDYIKEEGIVKQKGMPYQHFHPGKAERSHQTIMRSARAMLIDSKLPPMFYTEAQKTAAYLFNRQVHGNDKITPYEHIYGRKPRVDHLKPFGAIGYVHIPAENRSKLEDSGERCRLIGYGDDDDVEEVKGYKMLRESDLAVIYSKDVRFDENERAHVLPDQQLYEDDEQGDDLFGDPNYTNEDSAISESDSDEEYFSAEEQSTDDELSIDNGANLIEQLLKDGISPALIQECLNVSGSLPRTYAEAMDSKDAESWRKAMDREMESIQTHRTWKLANIPRNRRAVKCRWVYTKKYNKSGEVIKYKARLVAKGYTQKYGVDFVETFAPVIKFKSIRILASLAAIHKCKMYQDDVPTAFLKGTLKEEIYMDQVPGYSEGHSSQKLRLLRTLYGLKQSPREWNQVVHQYLLDNEFKQSTADPCIYLKRTKMGLTVAGVYVDDVVSFGTNQSEIDNFRSSMRAHFGITEGGLLEWYLGMSVDQENGNITIDQTQFLKAKLEQFQKHIGTGGASTPLPIDHISQLRAAELSTDIDATFPYRSMVGSLMYAMTGTRPDLAAAVSIVSRYLENPKKIHCDLVRHIYQYVKSNLDYKLLFKSESQVPVLTGYVDAAYGNREGFRSTSGYAFMLNNSLISWYSGRQSIVAQSTAESEYYAAVKGANECIWLKQLLSDLGFEQGCVSIMEDNQACISLSKNPEDHKRTKHIQVKYHVLRDYVKKDELKLVYCNTKSQLADCFTKILPGPMLRSSLEKLGVIGFSQSGGKSKYKIDKAETPKIDKAETLSISGYGKAVTALVSSAG